MSFNLILMSPTGPTEAGVPEKSPLAQLKETLDAIDLGKVDQRLDHSLSLDPGRAHALSSQQQPLLRVFRQNPPYEKPDVLFFPLADVLRKIWDQFGLGADKGPGYKERHDPMFGVLSDFLEKMHQHTRDYLARVASAEESSGGAPSGVSIGVVKVSTRGRAGNMLDAADTPKATPGTDLGRKLAAMDGQALLGFFEAQYSIDRKVANMLIERIWELRRAGRISQGERLDLTNLVLERLLRED